MNINFINGRNKHRSYLAIAIRVIADLVMLNLSIFLGVMVDAVDRAESIHKSAPLATTLGHAFQGTYIVGGFASAIAIVTFFLCGFYTRGRAYRGRYKIAIVTQAVAIVFLLLLVSARIVPSVFPITISAIMLSAACAVVMLLGSRLWSKIWKQIAVAEIPTVTKGEDGIKNVLVVGGAGYVGSALLPFLLQKGYRVRVLDNFFYGEQPIADLLGHRNLQIIRADFRQIDKVIEAMHGMDAVVHLGAIVGDPACALNEAFTVEVNLEATRMIAQVAKANGISRFIFASTCSVYGASDEVLDERSSLNPVSLYAKTKIACERVLQGMADERFRPTILRFGTVYGLSGRTRFDLVVNLLTAKAFFNDKITVFGADQWRPFVHVQDTALAVFKALDAPLNRLGNQVFNVGSDEQNKTLGDIGELVKAQVPKAELVISGTDGDRRNYRVNFDRIRKTIGFEPAWTLEAGIRQVLEACKSGEVIDYEDSRYSNVKFLSGCDGIEYMKTDTAWLHSLINDPSFEQESKVSLK